MRVIKFRAWTGKKLLPVYDLNCQDGDTVLFEGETVHMIKNEDLTLMQYTGLKDKNGTEIYEGDIIRYYQPGNGGNLVPNNNPRRIVSWREAQNGIGFNIGISSLNREEIIGNIYDNPELLK